MRELRYLKIGQNFYYKGKFYKKLGTQKGLTLTKGLDGFKKFKSELKVLVYKSKEIIKNDEISKGL